MDGMLSRIVQELELQEKKKIDLTNHLGMVNSAFGNWISGRNTSYTKYVHAIAEFLGVSVEYLRGETDIKKPPIRLDRELSAHESVVLAAYRDQPAMQPAVDKLLGVDEDTAPVAAPRSCSSDSVPPLLENSPAGRSPAPQRLAEGGIAPLDHIPPAPVPAATDTVYLRAAKGGGTEERTTSITDEEIDRAMNADSTPFVLRSTKKDQ